MPRQHRGWHSAPPLDEKGFDSFYVYSLPLYFIVRVVRSRLTPVVSIRDIPQMIINPTPGSTKAGREEHYSFHTISTAL